MTSGWVDVVLLVVIIINTFMFGYKYGRSSLNKDFQANELYWKEQVKYWKDKAK